MGHSEVRHQSVKKNRYYNGVCSNRVFYSYKNMLLEVKSPTVNMGGPKFKATCRMVRYGLLRAGLILSPYVSN